MDTLFSWFQLNMMRCYSHHTILVLGTKGAGKTCLIEEQARIHGQTYTKPRLELDAAHWVEHNWKDGSTKKGELVADALVIVVDCTKTEEQLEETKCLLAEFLYRSSTWVLPLVILGNRAGQEGAMTEGQIREALGLVYLTGKQTKSVKPGVQPIELFMVDLKQRGCCSEFSNWLTRFL